MHTHTHARNITHIHRYIHTHFLYTCASWVVLFAQFLVDFWFAYKHTHTCAAVSRVCEYHGPACVCLASNTRASFENKALKHESETKTRVLTSNKHAYNTLHTTHVHFKHARLYVTYNTRAIQACTLHTTHVHFKHARLYVTYNTRAFQACKLGFLDTCAHIHTHTHICADKDSATEAFNSFI